MSMRHEMARVGLVSENAETEDTVTQQQSNRGDRGGGGQRGRGGGGRQDRGRGRNQPSYSEREEFSGSFFQQDESGNHSLRSEFVSKRGVDRLARDLADVNPALTTGQIRRFFNHCRDIERRLRTDGESWRQVSASFEMLSSHAQYAQSTRRIPRLFQDFIDANVERVASADDPRAAFLEGFLKHFEALVGYGAQHFREDGRS